MSKRAAIEKTKIVDSGEIPRMETLGEIEDYINREIDRAREGNNDPEVYERWKRARMNFRNYIQALTSSENSSNESGLGSREAYDALPDEIRAALELEDINDEIFNIHESRSGTSEASVEGASDN